MSPRNHGCSWCRARSHAQLAIVGPGNLTEQFGSLLLSHLKWLEQKETEGVIVLAGPVDMEHGLGPGIAAIRADSREEAEAIAASEPFVNAGYRANTVNAWNANEGSLTLRVDLFANRITL